MSSDAIRAPGAAPADEGRLAQRRALFAASLALSMILCVGLVARDARSFGAALAILGLALGVGLQFARRLGGWLVALAVLNALLVVPELTLRATGFRCVSGVQFGYPTPEEFWEFVPDEQLFWRLPPGDDPPVNSLGFFGPEPEQPKPAGRVRLVVLGDSCTQQGFPQSVPDHLARILAARGVPLDLVNLSMSGYSTHQGRALAERVVPPLEPDLALVWYGWNDHWQAYGATDREKRPSLRYERLYRQSKLLQGLRWIALRAGLARDARADGRLRVPPDDFRKNLTAIAGALRAAGAQVVFVTAPTAHRRLGVPEYLVAQGFAAHPGAVAELHLEYAAIVRQVAAAAGVELLDFDATFETELDLRSTFLRDGIHLSDGGRIAAAELAAAFLEQRDLVPPAEQPKRP